MANKKRNTRDYLERILRVIGATYVSYFIMAGIYLLYNHLVYDPQDWAEDMGGYILVFIFINLYFFFVALISLPVLYIFYILVYYFIKKNNIRYLVLVIPFFILLFLTIIKDDLALFGSVLFLPLAFFTYFFNKKMDKNIIEEIPVIEDENLLDDISD